MQRSETLSAAKVTSLKKCFPTRQNETIPLQGHVIVTQCRVWMPTSLHVNMNASVTLTNILIQQDVWTCTARGMLQSEPQVRIADKFSICFG